VPSPELKPADRTRSVLGNTAVVALAQVSAILVSLLLTPYVLHTLGIERFGLWAFLGSIVAFAGLLQLSLGRGSIRFIAFYSERGELDVVRRIVSYGVLWHVVAGLALTPVAWIVGDVVLPHVHISRELLGTAKNLFPMILAYVFFAGAVRPLASLLIGLERMWMTSLTTLLSQALYAVFVVVLLSQGAGLYGLLAAAVLQTGLQATAYYLTCRRVVGQVFGNPFALDRRVVKEMVKFGGWQQGTAIAALVNRQTDGIVIGTWINVSSVGLYDIGIRVAGLIRTLPLTLLGPLFPAAASIHAQDDHKRLARTVLQASRLLGLLTIGMAGFVFATAPLIVIVWLGRAYPHVAWITILLAIAYVVNNLTGVGTTVVSAIGKPRYESEYAVIGAGLNIAATLALAPFFGLYGIIGGTVFGIVASSLYFLWRFHRLMRFSLWEYLGAWLWRLTAATASAALVVYVLRAVLPSEFTRARGGGALTLIALALVYGITLLMGLRAVRFFDGRDLAIVQRVLPVRLQSLTRSTAIEFLFGTRT
jgi:O-antigen/teichoic acid export membrane protein